MGRSARSDANSFDSHIGLSLTGEFGRNRNEEKRQEDARAVCSNMAGVGLGLRAQFYKPVASGGHAADWNAIRNYVMGADVGLQPSMI